MSLTSARAFNNLFPQYKVKWAASSMPFKQMENIAAFLGGLGRVPGIRSFDLFVTVDLFEGKNLEQVKRCLAAWKRAAERTGNDLAARMHVKVVEADTFKEKVVDANTFKDEAIETGTFKDEAIEANTFKDNTLKNQDTFKESSVSESGFEASRSTSYHSFEAVEVDDEQVPIEEEFEAGIEISFMEPEVILPPDSPIENNFADIDEPVIECVAEE